MEIYAVIYAIITLILLIISILTAVQILKLENTIKRTKTSYINSVKIGLVEIKGLVVPIKNKSLLKSPLSKKDCTYYQYKIEEYRESKNSKEWVTLKEESKYIPFKLKDNTGEILIEPDNATIDILKDKSYELQKLKEIPEFLKDFISSNQIKDITFFGLKFSALKRNLKITESYIEPNDNLYILGYAEKNKNFENTNCDFVIKKEKSLKDFIINTFRISDKEEEKILKNLKEGRMAAISLSIFFTIALIIFIMKIILF